MRPLVTILFLVFWLELAVRSVIDGYWWLAVVMAGASVFELARLVARFRA